MTVSELLREARVAAGLSQAELARRAGTSQPAVSRYESGESSPSVRTLERLLRAAGQRVDLTRGPAGAAVNLAGARVRRLRRYRSEIARAARRAGVTNVRVFGSVARGEDRPDSDIDLLVDFDVHAHGALPLVRLRRELDDLLGEKIDVATTELLRPEMAQRVETEAVPL
jgi:hypothetical protein